MRFSNANGVTFGMAGSNTITASVAAQTNQSAIKGLGVSNTGNTAGNTGLSTGIDWVIAGSNGITASESTAGGGPNTIWLSGVTTAAQTNQSAIKGLGVSNTGNTAGNTGLSTGIDWVIAGSNGITASQSTAAGGPDTIWLSGATQTNQSAIKGLGVSNTGNTAGNTGLSTGIDWVLAGTNNITVSESTAVGGPNTIWFSAPNPGGGGQFSAGASTAGNTAGSTGVTGTRLVLVGSNMVSLSQSTDANGGTVTWNATQTVQTQGVTQDELSIGMSNLGNTSGTSTVQTGQRFVFVGSNGITLSQSTGAGSTTLTISGITQTNQSAIKGLGVSNTGNTAGNTGLSTGIDWVLAGSNMITASQSTAVGGPDTIWLNATQTVQTQGITVDELSIGVSTGGNTSGNTTVQTGQRFVLAGGNNVTLSQATGAGSTTVTISAFNQTTQSAIKALGVSNTGNTAGNTGVSTGIDWVLAGSNMITASQSTAVGGPDTIWLNATQTVQTQGVTQDELSIGVSTMGNTAGTTTVQTGQRFALAGSYMATLSQLTAAGSTTLVVSAFNPLWAYERCW
jgi:hypothetical protein